MDKWTDCVLTGGKNGVATTTPVHPRFLVAATSSVSVPGQVERFGRQVIAIIQSLAACVLRQVVERA